MTQLFSTSFARYGCNLLQQMLAHTEWAEKVSCCIAGCYMVNYGPI